MKNNSKIPRLPNKIFEKIIPPYDRSNFIFDLNEVYKQIYFEKGKIRAKFWLWLNLIKSIPAFLTNKLEWSLTMYKNYFKITYRNFKRQKGYSLINLSGLAAGITCCVLMIFWLNYEHSYDKFHKNFKNIYRVTQDIFYPDQVVHSAVTQGPLAGVLKSDFPEIKEAARLVLTEDFLFRYQDRKFNETKVVGTDNHLFEIFSYHVIKGDIVAALNTVNSVIFTEKLCRKYFGDEDPIGKTIRINNMYNAVVRAVIEDLPENSHLDFEIILPLGFLKQHDYDFDVWDSGRVYTYILLQNGTACKGVETKIQNLPDKYISTLQHRLHLQHLSKVHFSSGLMYDFYTNVDSAYLLIFTVISGFILLIACINFMNLSTARSMNRAKEIGIRKVVGAYRKNLAKQFLGETLLLSLLACFIAVFISILLLPTLSNFIGKDISIDVLLTGRVLFGLILITIITGLIAGSYPALFLSGFKPVRVLKKSPSAGMKTVNLRRMLVVIQFTISIIFIIGTLVVNKQLSFIRNRNLGYDKKHIVSIPLARTNDRGIKYLTLERELLKNPGILGVSASMTNPTSINTQTEEVEWKGKSYKNTINFAYNQIYYNFEKTLGLELIEGRFFSAQRPVSFYQSSNLQFVINEEAAEVMGFKSAVGKQLRVMNKTGEIIGVVKNFHFQNLREKIKPLVLILDPRLVYHILVRVQSGTVLPTLNIIQENYRKMFPNYPFEYIFLDDDFNSLFKTEAKMAKMLNYFSFLAVFIACLGLIGLVSFTVEQRTKEIGIRKVLGASISNIIRLISREFILLITAGNLIALPVGYYFMSSWLQSFAYRTEIGVRVFLLSVVLSFIVAVFTVSFQAIRAAAANPVNSLRDE